MFTELVFILLCCDQQNSHPLHALFSFLPVLSSKVYGLSTPYAQEIGTKMFLSQQELVLLCDKHTDFPVE